MNGSRVSTTMRGIGLGQADIFPAEAGQARATEVINWKSRSPTSSGKFRLSASKVRPTPG